MPPVALATNELQPVPHNTRVNGHHLHVTAFFREPKAGLVGELQESGKIVLDATSGALPENFCELANAVSDVVLLDVDLHNSHEVASLEAFLQRNPSKPVVVTAANPTVEGLRHLMRLGVRDVVPHPVTAHVLLEALKTAAARPTTPALRPRNLGTVLCFLKSGGGAGATTLAAQGACALAIAEAKKKAQPKDKNQPKEKEKDKGADKSKICLIDLDVQFGGVAHQLDIEAATNVADIFAKSEHIDGSMVRTAAVRHRSGVDVLTAPVAVQPLDSVTPVAALRLVETARQEYEHVLIDLPTAWTAWTRVVLENASGIVVVVRPTVLSIQQARRQIQTLIEENLADIPLVVVANHVEGGLFRREISLKDAAKALDHPIAYRVHRNTVAMAEAADSGLLLSEVRNGRRSWKEITAMVTSVVSAALAADRPIAALAG